MPPERASSSALRRLGRRSRQASRNGPPPTEGTNAPPNPLWERIWQTITSIGILAGIYFTHDGLTYTARALETGNRTLDAALEAQITDRYTRAVEQLGSKTIETRIGGIYALTRTAKDSERDAETIQEVLCAYVQHRDFPEPETTKTDDQKEILIPKRPIRPDTDVMAALNSAVSLSKTTKDRPDFSTVRFPRADLSNLDLSRARLAYSDLAKSNLSASDLSETDLTRADLSGANLTNTNLTNADLTSTNLRDANLSHADLRKANLTGGLLKATLIATILDNADLSSADLSEANLFGARLRNADLHNADLSGSSLSSADLSGANLREANLTGVSMNGTNLKGADLRYVRGLTKTELGGAIVDDATRFSDPKLR
ncbi:pentapeptide repeat-containing protein [Sinosporangium siamense]|uniref:Pentapeptide repeat-containing protein n=1 Tax=Sinosporangium siamense TaxID=1367973 RepID=A0A919RDQ3_9ACTN|nr:pentapeptide repeat-containing protein [Sinosporangium siamense]GII91542.1 hypothetical protein Ssi02_17730 [Sinosporangium siamense]